MQSSSPPSDYSQFRTSCHVRNVLLCGEPRSRLQELRGTGVEGAKPGLAQRLPFPTPSQWGAFAAAGWGCSPQTFVHRGNKAIWKSLGSRSPITPNSRFSHWGNCLSRSSASFVWEFPSTHPKSGAIVSSFCCSRFDFYSGWRFTVPGEVAVLRGIRGKCTFMIFRNHDSFRMFPTHFLI